MTKKDVKQRRMRIALIAGGSSNERDVSLSGAAAVEEALDPEKFIVRRFDPADGLAELAGDSYLADFAFILMHGVGGEDGTIQGFLDLLKIPYQGSGVLGSAIAIDKHLSKQLYQTAGLPVADWQIIHREESIAAEKIDALVARFGLPVVAKPVREGSSMGMTLASTAAELQEGIASALLIDKSVMVEKYIKGMELTVGVLGNRKPEALPVILIKPDETHHFFDYDAKYQPGAAEEICPAPIEDDLRDTLQNYAVLAHTVLRLRGYSRSDFIVGYDGSISLLETNTIPGMTATSLFPQAAAEYGLDFPHLLERLIELGLEKE